MRRMKEVELSLRNVKLLLREKDAHLKEQVSSTGYTGTERVNGVVFPQSCVLTCSCTSAVVSPSPLTLPAAEKRESRHADRGSLRGERSAAEGSGDHRAAAEDRREEELPPGREDLQPEQDRVRREPLAAVLAALPV